MLTTQFSIRRSSLLLRHSVGIIKNNNNNSSKRSMSGWSKEEGGLSMVESWGDYREEEWLEDRKCAMYELQSRMRRLTIPTIQETVEKLVPTCLPLASTKEEKEMFEQAIAKFPQQALTLQDKLHCHIDNHPNTSWLQHWWNTDGYLKVNDPTLINVSYFFHFSPTSQLMIPRAVDLLYESAHFSTSIVHQSMPQRTISKRQTPLCSVAYKYMFNACRIPQSQSTTGRDSYRLYNPYQNRHVLISYHGQFYSMPLFHDNDNHQVLSKSILSQLLSHIYQQSSSTSTENALELGWSFVADMKSEEAIELSIKFAIENNFNVLVKTTGWSYTGSSSSYGSLMLLMTNFPKDGKVHQNYVDSCGSSHGAVVAVCGSELVDDVLEGLGDLYSATFAPFTHFISAAGGYLKSSSHPPKSNSWCFSQVCQSSFGFIFNDQVATARSSQDSLWLLELRCCQ